MSLKLPQQFEKFRGKSFEDLQKFSDDLVHKLNGMRQAIERGMGQQGTTVVNNAVTQALSQSSIVIPVSRIFDSGVVAVTAGTVTVSLNAPVTSSDYAITAWVIGSDEYSAVSPAIPLVPDYSTDSRTDASFQVEVKIAGKLHWFIGKGGV